MLTFGRACLALSLVLGVVGCESDEPERPPVYSGDTSDAGDEESCVDADGDGYGLRCELGNDCDDSDPESTDECRRCTRPAKGCSCTPGTAQVSCDPPVQHVAGGILVCAEGTRYCRDGQWGDCETIGDYVFVPN